MIASRPSMGRRAAATLPPPSDHVKALLANEPTSKVVEAVERAAAFLLQLSPVERLRKAGILSPNFWLKGLLPAC